MQIISSYKVAIKETFNQEKVSYRGNDRSFLLGNTARMKNRIREFRKAKGMTQEQLAISIGKVKSAISKLENGNADISGLILESIARALDCRPTDLIDDGSEKIAPDEIMILKKYRGLSERDRMKFVSMADMFLDVDKKLKSPTK